MPGVSSPFDDADIYAFKDGTYSRALDAVTDLRLPSGANVDALSWSRPGLIYLSFANTSTTVPVLGTVLDEQVVKYEDGVWSLFFNGATCGLNIDDSGDVDAIAVVGNVLYFSTLGNSNVSGLGSADDADVYAWVQGATNCTRAFDGSAAGLLAHADVDGLEVRDGRYYLSFDRDAGTTVPGLGTVQDEAVVSYDPTARSWALYFVGGGLNASTAQDIDAIAIERPIVAPPAPTLAIVSPIDGATVIGTTLEVTYSSTGDLTQASHANFRLDGGPDLRVPGLQGQFQIAGIVPGSHLLDGYLARADNSRIIGSDAQQIAFTTVAATQPPRLTITAPTANSTVNGPSVAVAFTSSGDLTEANHAHFRFDGGPDMMVMSLAGGFQIDEVAAGAHFLDGFLVRADHSKISGSDAATVNFTVASTSQAPRLTITGPANGATLVGSTIDVSFASAGDLAQADHVHLRLDGGADIMVMSLNGQAQITDVAPGPHFLDGYLVRADHSKIEGSDAARITFSVSVPNPNDPSLIGEWSAQVIDLPTVAVNLALLYSGKTIFWAGDFATAPNYGELWDPATNFITPVPNPYSNIFCSSHVALADGRLLVAGGHDAQNGIMGIADANTFDPASETWTSLPSMSFRRWYPTLTALGDGRAIIMSGSENSESVFVEIPEIYDPVANRWTQLGSARLSVPQYPMMFLLPDGRLLQAGSTEQPTATRVLDIPGQSWSVVDSRVLEGGSGVMYRPGRILKAGSASNDGATPTAASSATAYVLDMNQPTPAWRATASMRFARTFHNLTSLADGTVLVTSGSQRKSETNLTPAVLEAELWSPGTESWTTMAPMRTPRIYHSTAVLLPDGRVAVSGSGNIAGATDMKNLETFSPPYLFKGPRPVVSSAPARIEYGSTFTVTTPNAQDIQAVNLLRPGAATHNFDQDQRFVPLTFTRSAGSLQVQATANPNVAPPGYYMLFLINSAGVPSLARFVRFPAPYEDSVPPSAPGTVTASGSTGVAVLNWGAASDVGGIAWYEVHRSTVAGFTPSAATLVARPTGTTYTDSGLAAGTYYYVVIAVDRAGNIGPVSSQVAATVTADTQAPAIAVTTPSNDATVSGVVTVTATATDDVGVAGVQFRLDGVALGSEDTTAPYTFAWNTGTTTNGAHVITAVARDFSGNSRESIAVRVIVSNTQQAPAGLVAAYGFEEGAGSSLADASGNGNNGSVSGATWVTSGRFGNALAFDGVNDLVTVPDANSLDFSSALTLEAWVYPTALSGWRTVLLKEVPSELSYALYAHDNAPRPAGYLRIGGASPAVTGAAALPLNTWTHLAMTYDGITLRLYQNGTQVGSRALTGSIVTSSLPLQIGGSALWGEYFAGRIDEVKLYNRALTAAELQASLNLPVVPPPVVQPTRSTPITVDASARKVWVVNPDSDTVSALSADALAVLIEVQVGDHPTSVALDGAGQVWVTCRDDDTVWVLDAVTGAIRRVIGAPRGSAPVSIVFEAAGSRGYIALEGTGRIHQVTASATALGAGLDVGSAPRALAVTGDGQRLLVSQFISSGGSGRVRTVGTGTFASGATITLPLDTTSQDGSLAARGLPNYLAGIAINPANDRAWVVGKKDNLLRGAQRDGRSLTFETTVRALVSRLDLGLGQERLGDRVDIDNHGQPSAVALSPSGEHAFVTLQGNNRLIVLNQLGAEIVRSDTGLAPQGIAIDPITKRVFTQDLMSRTVSVFDAARLLAQGAGELTRIAQLPSTAIEKLSPAVLLGKQIFYNAEDTRMSRDGYLSCAACHVDGDTDGQVWDFTDRGEGLRNTTTLKGQGGNLGAPLHWTGNFDEVQDFENDIRSFFGGRGFMGDADFLSGTRAQPLGDRKAGLSPELDALAAYLESLSGSGRSPYRQGNGALTAGAVAGQALFTQLGCQSCHSGARFSDSNAGVRHDVGTIKASSGLRAGAPLDGLDTPTLLGLWASAPYLHDGSAPTLRAVLTTANQAGRHGDLSSLTSEQIDQLVEYLLQLELEPP